MQFHSFSVGLSAVAAIISASVAAEPRQPSGKWTLDYAENMCVLQRDYGSKERPLTLGIKPAPMSDDIQLIVVEPGGGSAGRSGKATVGFGEAGAAAEGRFISAVARTSLRRVTLIDLKRSDLEPLRIASILTIRAGNELDHALAVDGGAIAMKGLAACEKDLLLEWGMDERSLASIVSPPKPTKPVHEVFRDTDYPDQAIRDEEQGTVGMRYFVGSDGKVSDCMVVESSGSAILDLLSCRIWMTRAHFEPARDAAGKAVPSLSYSRVRWVL